MKEIRNKAEPFIPSYEWQKVEEGKPIPPGLYVRMNLQQLKLKLDLSAMNQKRLKLQMVKHHFIDRGLERESLGVMLYNYNFS